MLDMSSNSLSLREQMSLLGLNRSSVYYKKRAETEENILLMHRIDEIHTAHPFMGSRMITQVLKTEGKDVNRKRVQRLMREMGIEAFYPKPRTTHSKKAHRKYPYLLRNAVITYPNQVWCTDITYIRLESRKFSTLTKVFSIRLKNLRKHLLSKESKFQWMAKEGL